ncbi:MAG: hypothetical protein R6U98_33170 [Pirellulaceae bacterium]
MSKLVVEFLDRQAGRSSVCPAPSPMTNSPGGMGSSFNDTPSASSTVCSTGPAAA